MDERRGRPDDDDRRRRREPLRLRMPHLLAQGLEKLAFRKRLSTRWRVGIGVADPDNPDTLYQLEPAVEDIDATSLWSLRRDIKLIAENLEEFVLDAASATRSDPQRALPVMMTSAPTDCNAPAISLLSVATTTRSAQRACFAR